MALTRDEFFWSNFLAHSEIAVSSAQLLARAAGPQDSADKVRKEIFDLEARADALTREVAHALHSTWITPLDREEILNLSRALDEVVNTIDGAAERMRIYRIHSLHPEAAELIGCVVTATELMRDAVRDLKELKDSAALLTLLHRISEEEDRSDATLSRALRSLFDAETHPVELIKWRDLYERLERITDRTQDVANVIEAIVLEHV